MIIWICELCADLMIFLLKTFNKEYGFIMGVIDKNNCQNFFIKGNKDSLMHLNIKLHDTVYKSIQ